MFQRKKKNINNGSGDNNNNSNDGEKTEEMVLVHPPNRRLKRLNNFGRMETTGANTMEPDNERFYIEQQLQSQQVSVQVWLQQLPEEPQLFLQQPQLQLQDQFPAGLRVLVVDDDPTCLIILEKMLRSCLYEVTKSNRAEIALDMLRDKRNIFDIVISEVHMPDMDGFNLLEQVGLEMDLPVIMISADDSKHVVMKGVTHGACDYLIKPVKIEALKNIWQHVVRKRKNEWKEIEQSDSGDEGDLQQTPSEDVENGKTEGGGDDGDNGKMGTKMEPKGQHDNRNRFSYHGGDENGYPVGQLHRCYYEKTNVCSIILNQRKNINNGSGDNNNNSNEGEKTKEMVLGLPPNRGQIKLKTFGDMVRTGADLMEPMGDSGHIKNYHIKRPRPLQQWQQLKEQRKKAKAGGDGGDSGGGSNDSDGNGGGDGGSGSNNNDGDD